MIKLKFFKEDSGPSRKWYIDLPEYPGDKEDCLMVMGADTLLDIISGGGETLQTSVSLTPEFEENKKHIALTKVENESLSGAWYYVSQYYFHIWLCDVTKFVFNGEFPDKIFLSY